MLIMADHVGQVNINDAVLSGNTFIVKEEQCQQDCFTEDKVYISETAITPNNAESRDLIWHDKIKQYEESTSLGDIKTELAVVEVSEVQNDNVKIEEGIGVQDIKIKFDNGLLYCEHCEAYYVDYCIECGMLVHILNKHALSNADSGARDDIPNNILEIQELFGQTGIYSLRIIPAGVKFGPFTRLSTTEWPWEMIREKFILDKNKSMYLNWMQYVNPTKNIYDRNLHVFQSEDKIYYQSTRQIQAGDELLVYFGGEYGTSPNEIVREDFVTSVNDIVEDIFACTFCCLGFNSKSHLFKHKTVCVENATGIFSTEELTQCPYCKIHLNLKEYLEHHMAFCCERNARKCIRPTSPAKQAKTALHGRQRYLRQIFKCEQCKYRTKYQADLKEHLNNQHYEVKMYKSGVCNKRFKIKGSLRLHVENMHAYIGESDDQEHSMIDYRNTHTKVEQSSSQNQKKVFKCLLCAFKAKCKQSIRRHIKTKHLKEFDYKCESCEYKTNKKQHLEMHIKNKHLQEFDYKCDRCEFRTSRKDHLKLHNKTKHLKDFAYSCDWCTFRTNRRNDLGKHAKSIHLKEFDYKCDKCEVRTNRKNDLENHIKSKHLKEFDYKCDKCEFRATLKNRLEIHIKTVHLKQFDFKCDSCKYRTNRKDNLEGHIKTKHLKVFYYNCDLCEFRTNRKNNFEVHIKTKHLKEFNYKCDKCEYRSNNKTYLKKHTKTKHLK